MPTKSKTAKKSKLTSGLFEDAMLVSGANEEGGRKIYFYRVVDISPDGKTLSAQIIASKFRRRVTQYSSEFVPDNARVSKFIIKGKIIVSKYGSGPEFTLVRFGPSKNGVLAVPWDGKPAIKYAYVD